MKALVSVSLFISLTYFRESKGHAQACVCVRTGMCLCMYAHRRVCVCVCVCVRTSTPAAGTGALSMAALSILAQLLFQWHLFPFLPSSLSDLPLSPHLPSGILTPGTLTCWCSPEPPPSSEAPSSPLNKTLPYRRERKRKTRVLSGEQALSQDEGRWGSEEK